MLSCDAARGQHRPEDLTLVFGATAPWDHDQCEPVNMAWRDEPVSLRNITHNKIRNNTFSLGFDPFALFHDCFPFFRSKICI